MSLNDGDSCRIWASCNFYTGSLWSHSYTFLYFLPNEHFVGFLWSFFSLHLLQRAYNILAFARSHTQTENQFCFLFGSTTNLTLPLPFPAPINLIPPLTGALLVGRSWSRRNYVTEKESELVLEIAEWLWWARRSPMEEHLWQQFSTWVLPPQGLLYPSRSAATTPTPRLCFQAGRQPRKLSGFQQWSAKWDAPELGEGEIARQSNRHE